MKPCKLLLVTVKWAIKGGLNGRDYIKISTFQKMDKKSLCIICADDVRWFVKLNDHVSARMGPILKGILDDCAPEEDGSHIVRVPESIEDLKPLILFLREGEAYFEDLDNFASCKVSYVLATGRLDVPGFARAMESAMMKRVMDGECDIDHIVETFGGCDRIQALRDHYELMVGHAPHYYPSKEISFVAGVETRDEYGVALVFGSVEG